MTLPPVVGRDLVQERLAKVFPSAAFDTVLSSPIAAAAATTMLYIGAIVDDDGPVTGQSRLARPTTCLWMQPEVLVRTVDADREAWFLASTSKASPQDRTEALVTSWGLTFRPWYGDNSRETLRDEILRGWAERGAVRKRHDLPTTSGHPRWALTASFAALFDPTLVDDDLDAAIDEWRSSHMDPLDILRITTNAAQDAQRHAVLVTFPDGSARQLEAGTASLVLKGIVEQWAPVRLVQPAVLTLSEPGDKVFVADGATLARLGIAIDRTTLLPDALIVDIGTRPPLVWVVEAVATDGPITEARKAALLRWAEDQRIDPANVRFVSAFQSRNSPAAKRRLKDLAVGTIAWFLDEPSCELSWSELGEVDT